ncbi:drs2 neo1 protein, partial [Coemansia sp. RSA 486]
MYHPESDTRAEARTTAINEDLGMVRYVFSDKTGTLTENIMKLRAVMVAGFSYLHIDLDRLHSEKMASNSKAADASVADGTPGADDIDAGASGIGSNSPRVQRSSSRLSFLRPGTPGTPGNVQSASGRQSPSLFRAPMFSRQHRRQQSLPASMLNNTSGGGSNPSASANATQGGSRALQQLALTNRVASGSGGIRAPFARHLRGLSATVLKTVSPGPDASSQQYSAADFASDPDVGRLEAASAPVSAGSDLVTATAIATATGEGNDPDLAAPGSDDDPCMHTKASDDAPVSDLQQLPSSRRIMDSTAPPSEVFRARAEWFLRCIALCHTVQPDRDPLTGRITGYQAVSPDEKALVAAAAELGYVMNNRAGPLVQLRVVASERMRDFNKALIDGITGQSDKQTIPPSPGRGKDGYLQSSPGATTKVSFADGVTGEENDQGADDAADAGAAGKKSDDAQSFDRGVPAPDPTDRLGNYEVLDVLEFSSARKRMSVIYRCPDGRIVMMSKGADSAIWPRLLKTEHMESNDSDVSFMPRPTAPERVGNSAGGW